MIGLPSECPHGKGCSFEVLREQCNTMLFAPQGSDFWTSEAHLALCKESITRQADKSVQGAERFLFLVMVGIATYQLLRSLPGLIAGLPVHTLTLLGFGDNFSTRGAKRRLMICGFVTLPFVLKTASVLGLLWLHAMPSSWHNIGGVVMVAWMLAAPHQTEELGYQLQLLLLQNLRASVILAPALAMFSVAAIGAGTVGSYGILWPTDALYGVYGATS